MQHPGSAGELKCRIVVSNKRTHAEGHCEAPCVKSRSQNWDPASWKSHPKSFQVLVLEIASVKIQAPKLRSQVLKTMSWKPYPKISQVFLPALPGPVCNCCPAPARFGTALVPEKGGRREGESAVHVRDLWFCTTSTTTYLPTKC